MITPRWRKILSDLWSSKARTLLVALSIAVGVFAVGLVATCYIILGSDVSAAYFATLPHEATVICAPFDDDFLQTIRKTPGVLQVEGRTYAGGQVKLPNGQMVTMSVAGIPPVNEMKIDRVDLQSGSPDLHYKEVYLERSAMAALGLKLGDTVTMVTQDDRQHSLRVAGTIHDIQSTAFSIGRVVYAYASPETIAWLGGTREYTSLLVRVSENATDEAHVRAVTKLLTEKISHSGREVYITVIYHPGVYPGQSTINSALALLGGLGVLALLLSTFLVINTITALLNQQVRQIGMMKAIGATMGQVVVMYLVLIVLFSLIALVISIPLAGLMGYGLALGVVQLLNIDLAGFRFPPEALLLECVVGIGIPLFAGLLPVISGARLTVREAISNYGLNTMGARSLFDAVLESVRGLPRPLLISLRNTFRRKARLALTLFTLMLGGGIFISVFNMQEALNVEIAKTFGYVLSDVNVSLSRPYRLERVQEAVKGIPGLVSFEGWGEILGQAMKPDGQTGDDIQVVSPPAGSQMIQPVLTAGRWLVKEDENAVVIGNHFVKIRPDVKVGDTITLRLNNKKYPFRVVGIYKMAGTALYPVLYVNDDYLSKLLNQVGQVYSLRMVTDRHDLARQKEVAKALETRFNEQGFALGGVITSGDIIQQQRMTIDVLIYLLVAMSMLIALVGGLGLMGTMSMNVLERTREIGVMRSIGAVDSAIMQLVVVEGMVIGIISWVLGVFFAIPVTHALDNILGVSLLNVPITYIYGIKGLVIWVIVVIVLSALSSILPARNAVRLTVRDVLAYE